jgi:hypothetical protein
VVLLPVRMLLLVREPRMPPEESILRFLLFCSGPSPALSEGKEGPKRLLLRAVCMK